MPEHVLVPVDGSAQSWDALDHAVERFPDARITVLHVTDPMEWMYGDFEGGTFPTGMQERAERRGEELLEEAESRAAERGVEVETALELGRPTRSIVDYADEHDVDHIVMGTHGRSGLDRILLGSVAESVLRRSAVPVTVVR